MKHIITALAFATLAPVAAASSFCAQMGEMAEIAMGMRQSGIPPTDITAQLNAATGNNMPTFVRQVVSKAFEEPRYNSPEIRRRVEQEHRAHFEMLCLRVMNR